MTSPVFSEPAGATPAMQQASTPSDSTVIYRFFRKSF
jgi:hypothetical protein